jgi:hypothetical protein
MRPCDVIRIMVQGTASGHIRNTCKPDSAVTFNACNRPCYPGELLQSLQQQEVLLDALQPEEDAMGEAGNSELFGENGPVRLLTFCHFVPRRCLSTVQMLKKQLIMCE